VRCSGNDGTGDPEDNCKDRNPNDGKCGRRGKPTGGSKAGGIEAYTDSPSNSPEGETLTYSRITFCNGFFNLPSLSEVMSRTPRQPGQLDTWNNRAHVFLHETTHLDYFMSTPGTSPTCSDLQFNWRERGEVVKDWAYGLRFTTIPRNYGLGPEVGFYPQRNGRQRIHGYCSSLLISALIDKQRIHLHGSLWAITSSNRPARKYD
jgi:hypothetical protein